MPPGAPSTGGNGDSNQTSTSTGGGGGRRRRKKPPSSSTTRDGAEDLQVSTTASDGAASAGTVSLPTPATPNARGGRGQRRMRKAASGTTSTTTTTNDSHGQAQALSPPVTRKKGYLSGKQDSSGSNTRSPPLVSRSVTGSPRPLSARHSFVEVSPSSSPPPSTRPYTIRLLSAAQLVDEGGNKQQTGQENTSSSGRSIWEEKSEGEDEEQIRKRVEEEVISKLARASLMGQLLKEHREQSSFSSSMQNGDKTPVEAASSEGETDFISPQPPPPPPCPPLSHGALMLMTNDTVPCVFYLHDLFT